MRPRLLCLMCAFAALLVCACGGGASLDSASPMPVEAPIFGGLPAAMEPAAESDYGEDEVALESEGFRPDNRESYARRTQTGAAGEAHGPPPAKPATTPAQPPTATPEPPAVRDATAPPTVKQAKPLLIYTANYTLAVFEATASIDAVQKLATDLGGYLVRRDDRSITVRVPSERFRGALGKIAKLGDVLHHEETVQDVTEQFLDLQTRLKNARAMRDRLEQLLAAAKDVKDALAVEKELGRVTAEIESMEGKLKRLRELIAFSTITVEFQARPSDRVDSNVRLPFPWLNQLGLSRLLSL